MKINKRDEKKMFKNPIRLLKVEEFSCATIYFYSLY